ncbi:MAG: 2-C-methyl-D-erythritol 4-phosphate cytidylyltransferase [bacterium]
MKVSTIIPSAGYGERMGGVKKPYILLDGKPILSHTLKVFQKCPLIDDISIVVAAGDEQKCLDEVLSYGNEKVSQVIAGGSTRQESVFNALKSLSPDTDLVIIHDCVRPFITNEIISASLDSAVRWGAAIVAVPVKDTIKESDDNLFVSNTLNRQRLWSIQTPQVFKYEIIFHAHLLARERNIQATDDASLVEMLGNCKVRLVMGNYENIKITTPFDLIVASAILKTKSKE